MKHLKLVVALVVISMVATSLVFAGMAKTTKGTSKPVTPQSTVSKGFINKSKLPLTDTDSPAKVKAGASALRAKILNLVSKNPSIAKPEPEKKQLSSVTAGLSGVYHIPGDFPDISSAAAVVNFIGLSGNATFELDATSYTEHTVTFGAFPDTGSYVLTIAPGASVNAVVNFRTDSTHGKGFAFVGASNITIDGSAGSLTLQYASGFGDPFPTNDPFGATVYITGGSSNIAVQHASVKGLTNTPAWIDQTDGRDPIFIYGGDSDPAASSGITLDHLTITNGIFGIKTFTGPAVNNLSVDGLTVSNCNIGGAFGNPVMMGAWYEFSANVTYANNVFDGIYWIDTYWFNGGYTDYDVDQVFAGIGPILYNFGYVTASYFALTDNIVNHDNIFRNVSVNPLLGGTQGSDGISLYAMRIYDDNFGYGGVGTSYNNRYYNITNFGGAGGLLTGLRGPTAKVYQNSFQLIDTNSCTVTAINSTGSVENNAVEAISNGAARGIAAGDYNAINAATPVVGFATSAAAAVAGINKNGAVGPINFTADLHLNAAGPSAASGIGAPEILGKNDIDGQPRDTTFAGSRDAGADQVGTFGSQWTNDVGPGGLSKPVAGAPVGLAVAPIVVVKNNANNTAGPFNVELAVSDGYDQLVSVTLAPHSTQSVTFPAWTPAAAISYTFTMTTHLTGDNVPGNDVATKAVLASAPVSIPLGPNTVYNWDGGANGWLATNDWVLSNSFTKLGGPLSGKTWVTNCPSNAGTYTEGAYANSEGYASTYPGANTLTSPWFDLSALTTDIYISFQHSIAVEPGWDGSWVDYSTDGVTWHHLGVANDAVSGAVNWYNHSVYQNNPSFTGNPPDTATMALSNYGIYGAGTDNPTLPVAWWTSNGIQGPPVTVAAETGQPLGPFGYVFAQYHINASNYPALLGNHLVKFRYVAFSDAVNPGGGGNNLAADVALGLSGWAIDNFQIGANGASFTGNTISGLVYQDLNGNGLNDDATPDAGVKVALSYFGVPVDQKTTAIDGSYSFNTYTDNHGLPGTYNVTVVKYGYAVTSPVANVATVNVSAVGDSSVVSVAAIGTYLGSFSDPVYNDLNNNGVKDGGETGLAGWTVNINLDSLHGPLVASAVTAAGGLDTIPLAPGTYVASVTQKAGTRGTQNVNGASFTIGGTSGSGTAVLAPISFGEFFFGSIRDEASIDYNGNGVKDLSDHTPLGGGVKQLFEFRKEGTLLGVDTLGNTITSVNHTGLDTGTYTIKRLSAIPAGYLKTSVADSFSFTISTGSTIDTANTLYFDLAFAQGNVFNDLNGNGVQDTLEPSVPNWPVVVTGSGGGTVMTDSNGNWRINTIGPGSHNISIGAAPLPGTWTTTLNSGSTFTGFSGGLEYVANNKYNVNFGEFKDVTVYGVKYNDRNDNGAKGAGEEGLAGWVINAATTGGSILHTDTTDANGNFTFLVGPTPDTLVLSEVNHAGWVNTQPGGSGKYTVILHSGDSVGYNFGNFFGSDTVKYRTWTAAQWFGGASTKPVKAWAAKKPTVPNLSNVVNNVYLLVGGPTSLQVGAAGQMNSAGKEKAYILGAKYSDIWATFSAKGTPHDAVGGPPRGFDFFKNASVMLKKQKSVPESKKDDILIADALALKLNLEISKSSMLTLQSTGLGNLIYREAGNPLGNGTLTVSAISTNLDTLMTNWEGVPFSTYVMYDSVIAKINAAFSDGSASLPYDTSSVAGLGWKAGALTMPGLHSIATVPFLIGNPGAKPTQAVGSLKPMLPTVYALAQNYPNPFNPTSTVQFDVPGASIVTIKVYNILGQEVASLLNQQSYSGATRDVVTFDGSNLASGVYFYRMTAQTLDDNGQVTGAIFTQVKKMMMVK